MNLIKSPFGFIRRGGLHDLTGLALPLSAPVGIDLVLAHVNHHQRIEADQEEEEFEQ